MHEENRQNYNVLTKYIKFYNSYTLTDLSANPVVVLTEVIGFDITSEHITLRSEEERVTRVSQSHNSDRTNAANLMSPNNILSNFIAILYLVQKGLQLVKD